MAKVTQKTRPQPTTAQPLPAGVDGWNWGAAFLTWIWGTRFNVWIAFMTFVPIVGIFWWIVLGIKGNEWAWRANSWTSVKEFQNAQHPWNVAGIVILVLAIVLPIFWVLLFGIATSTRSTVSY